MDCEQVSRLRLPPTPTRKRGIEPLLGRMMMAGTVALFPLAFSLVAGLFSPPGEGGAAALMVLAVMAAAFAMPYNVRARLMRRANQPPSFHKTIVIGGEIVGMLPDCDLATIDVTLLDRPGLALAQARRLLTVFVQSAFVIAVVTAVMLVWEILFFIAVTGPTPSSAFAGTTYSAAVNLIRSLTVSDLMVCTIGAALFSLSGRRFGFRNEYREARDRILRDHFGFRGEDVVQIPRPGKFVNQPV